MSTRKKGNQSILIDNKFYRIKDCYIDCNTIYIKLYNVFHNKIKLIKIEQFSYEITLQKIPKHKRIFSAIKNFVNKYINKLKKSS